MRARWLKPDFFTDKKIAAGGAVAALVYQALWCMADDSGTAPCDPDTVKSQLFYRWSAVGVPEITEALRHLSGTGRIVRYQAGDDTYATISRWDNHQKVHKPSTFRYPVASEGVMLDVPEEYVPSGAPLPASPPSRHLDTQTSRHLDTQTPTLPRKAAAPRETWLTPFLIAWKGHYGGDLSPGKAAKALAPIYKVHDAEEVLRRWTLYLTETEASFATPVRFAETFGQWVPGKSSTPKKGSKPAQYTYEPTEGEDIQWAK